MKQSRTKIIEKFLSVITAKAVMICFLFPVAAFSQNNVVLPTGAKNNGKDIERIKQISLKLLKNLALRRGVTTGDSFAVQKIEIDELKMSHTRFRQMLGDIPVWGGEAIVHLKADNSLFTITDDLKKINAVGTKPNLSAADAIRFAKGFYQGSKFLTAEPKVDLWIFPAKSRTHLAFRVRMRRIDGSNETAMPVIFIDAQTGEKIFEYDNLQTGSGSSFYNGTVSINTSNVGTTYYMEDLTRKMGTFNMNSTGNEILGLGGNQLRFTGTDDLWNASIEQAAVDAHYGAAKTFDYFLNVHGRNGIDGYGGPSASTAAANSAVNLITSRVHYGNSGAYNNAFWDDEKMSYGDGDGVNFSPLVTIDICGHEMTHGVTQFSAGLIYQGESGALNESMSDVFGAMVELYADGGVVSADTWKIGEDAYKPGTPGDALRYMDDPHKAAERDYTTDDDPDHYSERYTGTSDSGGVHTNSGIANKAFYLLAAGGTHHKGGSMNGIGTNAAAKIWYRALTFFMTEDTDFRQAKKATLDAATSIYGSMSTQYNAVEKAWTLVGVVDELLDNSGFENGDSPWVGSGKGYFYTNTGENPHDGTGYIYLTDRQRVTGESNNASGKVYYEISIPDYANGNLTFWLNVSSNEITTAQRDKLYVEVRDKNDTLLETLATYSNLNKGADGVYSQQLLKLSAYKGNTVRIQFRSDPDSSLSTTFRIDDVSLK